MAEREAAGQGIGLFTFSRFELFGFYKYVQVLVH